jgi:hypothetical protein
MPQWLYPSYKIVRKNQLFKTKKVRAQIFIGDSSTTRSVFLILIKHNQPIRNVQHGEQFFCSIANLV